MRHIISLLMENEAGALSRVAGLFSARGYNIESLSVAPTDDATLSRMTIVTRGSDAVIEQITKQLNKLIDVAAVMDLTDGEHIKSVLSVEKHTVFNITGHRHSMIKENFTTRFIVIGRNDIIFDVVAKLRAAHCGIALITKDGSLEQPGDVIGALSLDDIAHSSYLAKHIITSGM